MTAQRKSGDQLTLAVAASVTAGDVELVGSILGVAVASVELPSGDTSVDAEFATRGEFELPAAELDTPSAGDPAYWDNTAGEMTTTASGNWLVGAFSADKASGELVARVWLPGMVAEQQA